MEAWKSTTARWPATQLSMEAGGVFNVSYSLSQAILQINNSTISGGSAQTGGGIDNESDDGGAMAYISNGTFSGNSASDSDGGSVFNSAQGYGSAVVHLNDTILQGGATGGNILNQGVLSHRTATTLAMTAVAA